MKNLKPKKHNFLKIFYLIVSCIRTTFWCRRMMFSSDVVGDDVTRISLRGKTPPLFRDLS